MGLLSILLLGIGLSLDTFAVSLSLGFACDRTTPAARRRFLIVIGLFHFLMICAGWLCGAQVSRLIASYDHWIAFGLLAGVGIHMIHDGITDHGEAPACHNLLTLGKTLMLGIALSIDALISGFSLGLIPITLFDGSQGANVLMAATLIGATALLISAIGLRIGRHVSGRMGPRAEIFGGFILFCIGLKTLLEHLLG